MPLLTESKCTCCGAPINPSEGEAGVIRCDYCGSIFTLTKKETDPAALDSIRIGNHELDIGKFDDAYESFKKAAQTDSNEPESYMGMAYAAHKVRYIRDEVNNCLQPICYEYEDKQFIQDNNYIKATKLATPEQLAQYERNAADIDYIHGEFNKLRNSGLDYDCFICVKVTDDETRGRTADYKIADDIYFHLRGKGYKPFFSEREIGNRTGADYEALILYALYSSECMIVVCGNESYLQTPWVKNEYSRFLKLVADEEKESDSITIVFNGKPIEKLPNRKGKLQGIDMSGIDPYGKITAFVEEHTPEARARREHEKQRRLTPQESAATALLLQLEQERKEREEKERKEKEESDFDVSNGILKKYNGNGGNVTIPDGVTSIGYSAFSGCNSLTSITIGNKVTKIEEYAFNDCKSLTNVIIPDSVTNIGRCAFGGCVGLTNIEISNSITSISDSTFNGCRNLTNITIPSSVTNIGSCAFYGCINLISITLSDGVTNIGASAFSGCTNLTNITMPNSIKSIGGCAFSQCSSLKRIVIPSGVTNINNEIFSSCINLTTITISNNVTNVGDYAFKGCSSLTNITIPNSVTSIGKYAFSNCRGLSSTALPDSLVNIGDCAFYKCSGLLEVTIPKKLKKFIKQAFGDDRKHIKFTFTK